MNLLSVGTLVESPFIILEVGKYTLGTYTASFSTLKGDKIKIVNFPNFMDSMTVMKINGTVNTYTINLVYQISQGDDPNLLDKIFGSVSDTRKITISYGDYASPSFVFKKETAIITQLKTQLDFAGSKLRYTIQCTSDSLYLKANRYDFGKRVTQPSTVIKELLQDEQFGLTEIFYGMKDWQKVLEKGLISFDDKSVTIPAKTQISVLEYLNYLVNCMVPKDSEPYKYYLQIFDTVTEEFKGPYFIIKKVSHNTSTVNSLDTYELDVGFPQNNYVTQFAINTNDSWALLYNYSEKINQQTYVYRINDNGDVESILSPNILSQTSLKQITPSQESWWTSVTEFPITASVTIKGLLRPAMLMTYIKLNVYFYGQKHISSGTYIVTKQEDTINKSGYKTTLSLTRISGDNVDKKSK